MFSFIVLLLFTSLGCYGILEINGDELLLKTDSIMHARHVRGTDKGNLEGHHVVSRRPARREPQGLLHESPNQPGMQTCPHFATSESHVPVCGVASHMKHS
ncbi:hypothetical protein LOAG_03517 [Loa loa]|uniref:Secreted protein n=1 Tax=Loa loa TaxID=7209 RepID=A0A1S0U4I1_LOALO|nr:hypothetical protein LOAG_03517 [Loa loa]EFO24972.1 hypothetical protein LOAG_03517 [Loa loa]